jgi:hypothetical protein
MSNLSGRFGVRLLGRPRPVDVPAAMRAIRPDHSFEGERRQTPGCHDFCRGGRCRGGEPLSVVRCNRLTNRSRSKPSRW